MSFDPNIDSPFAPRRVSANDDAPLLPVLARLPRVGPRAAASAERLPTYAALEPEADVHSPPSAGLRGAPPLRVVDPASAELSPSSYATRIDPPQGRRPAPPLEPADAPARGYDWPAFDERTPPADRPTTPPRREQYRIDAAVDNFHGSHYARRPSAAPLSAHVAQWHAALAPRSGVAVTVVLLLAVSFLYWFTVGRRPLATDGEEIMDLPSAWSSETPSPPPLSAEIRPFEAQIDHGVTPSIDLKTPRIAEATVVPPAAEAPLEFRSDAGIDGPTLGPELQAIAPADASASTLPAEEPITPTPSDSPYPVTAYPDFNFGPSASNGAAPQTTTGATMPASPGY